MQRTRCPRLPNTQNWRPKQFGRLQRWTSLSDFQKHAADNLGPSCGPATLDLCDAAKKALIEKYQAMAVADLEKFVEQSSEKIEKAESDFKKFVEGLQKKYEEENKAKDETVEEIKNLGLGFAKAVMASKKSKEEL